MSEQLEHVVIVDDDERLRNRLRAFLEKEGYRATAVDGGAALRARMAETTPDLVILDLTMPGEDGLSLTRFLREISGVGIVILTGKGDAVDRIVGLELGADDYIAKPFELRELLARIRSVIRRLHPAGPAAAGDTTSKGESPEGENIVFESWNLDLVRHRLTAPDGRPVHLTTAEFGLLAALAASPNRPLDRDRLLDEVGGRDWQPFDRSIDLHISHLRRKLGDDPKDPTLIKTVRGAGYMLAAAVERK